MSSIVKYVLLDAERMGNAIKEAQELNPNHQSLYRTREGAEEVSPDEAPYLFTWPHSEAFSHLFLQEGWGQSWGVLIKSSADFKTLYQHLRRFLTVQLEGGNPVRFRFYDPRVLRLFLPTCHAGQLKEFFGPVTYFLTEDEEKEQAIKFSFQNDNLVQERLSFEKISGHPVKTAKSYVSVKDIENNAAAPLNRTAAELPAKAENAVKPNIPGKGKWNLFD